jgi:hypothetical protein
MRLNIECAATRRAVFIPPRALTSKRADLSTGISRGPSAKPPLPNFLHFRITQQINVAPALIPRNHVSSWDTPPSRPMATGCPHARRRPAHEAEVQAEKPASYRKGTLWDEDQEASTTPRR